MNSSVEISETQSGIPVITEHVPSSGMGVLTSVRTGSRDEREGIFGLSHLLEHTVFRETKNMDSFEMAKAMEGAGGELNAFTSKEMTAFYGITLAETGDVAMRMVADIVANPLINEKDTELEKEIVLQELSMIKSEPESYIRDLFEEHLWAGHPLGWDEGGSEESVAPLTFEDLREYYAERYGRPNLAVFATGSVDSDRVVEWAEESFSDMGAPVVNRREEPPLSGSKYTYTEGEAGHIQIGMGFPVPKTVQAERDALSVLSALLGGGTSSRLFQQVREKNALVYSIYNTASNYSDAGYLATFMSCTPKNVMKAMDETISVLENLLSEGISGDELQRTKNFIKGAHSRSAETTDSRIYRLCRSYMTYGAVRSTDEALAHISEVTAEDVMSAAEKTIKGSRLNVSILGKAGKAVQELDLSSFDLRS